MTTCTLAAALTAKCSHLSVENVRRAGTGLPALVPQHERELRPAILGVAGEAGRVAASQPRVNDVAGADDGPVPWLTQRQLHAAGVFPIGGSKAGARHSAPVRPQCAVALGLEVWSMQG